MAVQMLERVGNWGEGVGEEGEGIGRRFKCFASILCLSVSSFVLFYFFKETNISTRMAPGGSVQTRRVSQVLQ